MTGQINKWIERMYDSEDGANSQEDFPAMGGSEILRNGLYKHTDIDKRDINLMLSTPDPNRLQFSKKNLLWQHLSFDDESVSIMSDRSFVSNLDAVVYVSNWQYEKYRYFHNVPVKNSYVIKNAIEPIEFVKRDKSEKIKLIYTSTPFRGLDVLLESFNSLNRDDVELHVYSSNDIYGSGYKKFVGSAFDHIFDRARQIPNVFLHGYKTNDEIKSALQEAHIFAYPSTFEETCCLAMIEAAAAGCKMVTTNLGALYETGSQYATYVNLQETPYEMVAKYSKALDHEIDTYWSRSTQQLLKEQSDFYNKFYSWELRSKEWLDLFDRISD